MTGVLIVLIEDDTAVAQSITDVIGTESRRIVWFPGLEEARAHFAAQVSQVRLVISDVQVGGDISFGFLLERVAHVCPLLVITGSEIELPAALVEAGATLLRKPLSAAGLRQAVAQALSVQ